MIEKSLIPPHPAGVIITGPSECGETVFLTNLSFEYYQRI